MRINVRRTFLRLHLMRLKESFLAFLIFLQVVQANTISSCTWKLSCFQVTCLLDLKIVVAILPFVLENEQSDMTYWVYTGRVYFESKCKSSQYTEGLRVQKRSAHRLLFLNSLRKYLCWRSVNVTRKDEQTPLLFLRCKEHVGNLFWMRGRPKIGQLFWPRKNDRQNLYRTAS